MAQPHSGQLDSRMTTATYQMRVLPLPGTFKMAQWPSNVEINPRSKDIHEHKNEGIVEKCVSNGPRYVARFRSSSYIWSQNRWKTI